MTIVIAERPASKPASARRIAPAQTEHTLGEQQTLVRISLPRPLGEAERAGTEKLVMHPDVNAVAFRYMTRDAAGGAVWPDYWNQARLPVTIRFEIDLVGAGRKQSRSSRTVNMLR
ncbi:hypothetical protein [Sinorhizobium medicae]|uniref:hypothetical protein n=1 Tax=Sinorhizobium medicae TaxID=110321 RepID=UPI0016490D1B|nr:hypothetical protein [Sinorhizobium medicae]